MRLRRISQVFYGLICRRYGHELYVIGIQNRAGDLVEMEGCARGCGWHRYVSDPDEQPR